MSRSQDEQVSELNEIVKCKLSPSKISGVGVFALRDIKKGERLYLFPNPEPRWYTIPMGSMNKLFPEIRELILGQWASIVNGSHFLSPNDTCWMILYCNHSDQPNYQVDGDVAIKDIPKGSEVLEDYKLMNNYQRVYTWIDKTSESANIVDNLSLLARIKTILKQWKK